MDRNILGEIRAPRLRLYAVWMRRLKRDARAACDPAIFGDPRATVFWDGKQVLGGWLARAEKLPAVVWDTYYLFGPDAKWEAAPAPLVASGFPVRNYRSDLGKYVREAVRR